MPSPRAAHGLGPRVLPLLILVLLIALAAPLLMRTALEREPVRDEHQFAAAAALWESRGLLPFRDYPFFHVPYQVPVQALFIKLGPGVLTASRLCSLAFGLGTLGLVFWGAWRCLGGLPRWLGLSLAAALALWLTHSPLFVYATGRAWNHDMSTFLALAAFLALGQALGRPRPGPLLLASGLLWGLAVGARLSWVPAGLAMLAALYWLGPAPGQPRSWRLGLPLLAGMTLAGLPLLVLALSAWDDFVLGALIYPGRLTTGFWAELGYGKAMDMSSKLDYFRRQVLPSPGDYALFGTYAQTWLLMTVTLVLTLPLNLLALVKKAGAWRQSGLALLLLPLVFMGAMLPTPNMYQYHYQTVPLSLLALALALGALPELLPAGLAPGWLWAPLALLAAWALVPGGFHLARAACSGGILAPGEGALAARSMGQELARQARRGPVLTLAPIYPLEGGLEIYPELACGPFPLRVAHLLPPGERRARRMIAPADLEELLAARPPAAILTGTEKELDPLLAAHAKALGFQPRRLGTSQLLLWLPARLAGPAQGVGP